MSWLRVTRAGLTIVLLLMASSVRADEPARTHDVTIDDYFTLAFVSEVAISPDGESVAYAEGRWQSSTNDRKADLWVAAVGTGEATRLTFDRAGYSGLQWASDRQHIYLPTDSASLRFFRQRIASGWANSSRQRIASLGASHEVFPPWSTD